MAKQGGIKGLLQRGFSDFQKLTRRSLITEKLAAINMLLYRFSASIILTAYLWQVLSIHPVFIFLIAFFISSLSLFIYIPILQYITEHAKHLIEGLRASIIIMFLDLTLAIAGLLFFNIVIITIAFAIIIFQLVIILISNIKILTKPKFDRNAEPPEVWKYVGWLPISCGIASLLADLILVIYRYLFLQQLTL